MIEDKGTLKKLHLINLGNRLEEMIKFRVPTGILAVDRVIGGGIPAGRLTELYGDFITGKSRLAYHVLANTQKLGGTAVLIDNERALGQGLCELTGLDMSSLVYPDPDEIKTIEDVFECFKNAINLFKEKSPDGLMSVVWDSVAASPGIEDLEKSIGRNEASMRRAKLISDGLKQMIVEVYRHKIVMIFINQIRDKIGVMFGEKVETIGGRAIKFQASLRMHLHLVGNIKNEKTEELAGNKVRLVVEKSRVSKPFGMVRFDMLIDKPLGPYDGLLDYLIRHSEAEETAGWYNFPGQTKKFRASDFQENYENWLAKNK